MIIEETDKDLNPLENYFCVFIFFFFVLLPGCVSVVFKYATQ